MCFTGLLQRTLHTGKRSHTQQQQQNENGERTEPMSLDMDVTETCNGLVGQPAATTASARVRARSAFVVAAVGIHGVRRDERAVVRRTALPRRQQARQLRATAFVDRREQVAERAADGVHLRDEAATLT